MKRQSLMIFVIIGFLSLLLAAPAGAQDTGRAEFHIPFSFMIQGRLLPAGTYTVERLDKSKPEILIIKNSDGRTKRIFFTQRVEAADFREAPVLVFSRYGDEHILSEVWTMGARSGRQLPQSTPKNQSSNKPVVVLIKGARLRSR